MPVKSTAKRQRGEGSKTKDAGPSLNVFVSVAAEEQFNNYNKNRACIRERGFALSHNPTFAFIQETIQTRGWSTYCSPPKDGSMTLVREFYANAREHRNHKTKVRGIVVRFDEETINRYLGLVAPEEDELANYTKEADMQKVMDTICFKQTQWNVSNGVQTSFDSKYLEKTMKVWFNFITARLYPTTHVSECTRERALALFAIATGMRMNVGAIINATILHAASINNVALPFPSLLTALFEKAGIDTTDNAICRPIRALDPNGIVRIWNNQPEDGEDEAGPSRASARRKSKASISDIHETYQSYGERLDDIQAQLAHDRQWHLENAEYQASCFNTIEQMFQHFGFSSGHDMTGFPQMPPFPDHLRHPYQQASQPPGDKQPNIHDDDE